MAAPTKITYDFSFLDHTVNDPDVPQPGDQLDEAFNEVKRASDETIDRLNMIQRDDGELARVVGPDQLREPLFTEFQDLSDAAAQSAADAAQSAANAQSNADAAATSAQNADGSAQDAAQSADAAAASAQSASDYEDATAQIVSEAQDLRGDAAQSALEAQNSADAAAQSASDALASRNAAAVSAANALTSEQNAGTYATEAFASEQSAAASAANAHTSEQNAGQSAQDAEQSAVTAANILADLAGGTSGQFLAKLTDDDYEYAWIDLPGGGDMQSGTYDPQGIASDVFNRSNHTGKQEIATISGLSSALSGKAPLASPEFTGTPTAPTAEKDTNSDQIATTKFVQTAVNAIINGAPGALDTLRELADAMGNDPNFSATMINALAEKLDITVAASTYALKNSPTISGTATFDEIVSTSADSYRLKSEDFGVFWRLDGADFGLRLTDLDDAEGEGNSLRPFEVNVTTGQVTFGSGVSVNGNVTAAGDVSAFSDVRLKTDVETIEDALGIVMRLRGVRYTMNGKRGIGVVAQEFQKHVPELVLENDDDAKTLSVIYGNTVGLLIEAIKGLKAEVDALKRGAQ